MAREVTLLRVFISGPGDTIREQQLVARTIRSMNQSHSKHLGLLLQGLSWKDDIKADFGLYAQDVINQQVEDEWDIYVGVLWARHGTPTLVSQSGTEEEFDIAYERWKADKNSCKVAVFFSEASLPASVDAGQLQKVQAFKRKVGDIGGIYTPFSDSEDFVFKIRDYLTEVTHSYRKDWGITPPKFEKEPMPPNQPNVHSFPPLSTDAISIAIGSLTAFLKFGLALNTNSVALKTITAEMRQQIAFPKIQRTEAERKLLILTIEARVSTAFLTGSNTITKNLPVLKSAWGDLSTALFRILFLPEFKSSASKQNTAQINSKMASLVPQINAARDSLRSLSETFETCSFANEHSRSSLVKTLQKLDNEYAFMADECSDIDVLLKRRLQ